MTKAWLVAIILLLAALPAEATGSAFNFAVMGDAPYNAEEEARFYALLESLNSRQDLAFVVHVGDFKGGLSECADALFVERKQVFDASRHPFIYVPGDNEWSDCWRPSAGGYEPVERLQKLRALFFQGNESLGQRPLALKRQSGFPENARWHYDGILFVTLNIPGGNNNFHKGNEYEARNRANLAWLEEGFGQATDRGVAALVLFIHGNPGFEGEWVNTGYRDFVAALEQEVREFKKPVLLAHGDRHRFRVDQPLTDPMTGSRLMNFTRLETFGSPTVAWVRVNVDSRRQPLFLIEPVRR
jgi:hypothetical protein